MAKQGGLAILLGAAKGKEDDVSGGDEFTDAADDVFDAIQDGDKKSFALALKRAIHACEDEYEGEETAPESEG